MEKKKINIIRKFFIPNFLKKYIFFLLLQLFFQESIINLDTFTKYFHITWIYLGEDTLERYSISGIASHFILEAL